MSSAEDDGCGCRRDDLAGVKARSEGRRRRLVGAYSELLPGVIAADVLEHLHLRSAERHFLHQPLVEGHYKLLALIHVSVNPIVGDL